MRGKRCQRPLQPTLTTVTLCVALLILPASLSPAAESLQGEDSGQACLHHPLCQAQCLTQEF